MEDKEKKNIIDIENYNKTKDSENIIKDTKQQKDNVKPTIIISVVFITIFFIINYIDIIINNLTYFLQDINIERNNIIRESIAGIFLVSTIFTIFLSIASDNIKSKDIENTNNNINQKFKLNRIKTIALIITVIICIIFYKNFLEAICGIAIIIVIINIIDKIYKLDINSFIHPMKICMIYLLNIIIFTFCITGYDNRGLILVWLLLFSVFIFIMNKLVKFKLNFDASLLTLGKVVFSSTVAYWFSILMSLVIIKLFIFVESLIGINFYSSITDILNLDALNVIVIVIVYWISSMLAIDVIFKNYLSDEEYKNKGFVIHRFNKLSNLIFMIIVFAVIKIFKIGITKHEIDLIADAITLVSLLILFIDKRNEKQCFNNNVCCRKNEFNHVDNNISKDNK